jgi:phosphoribosylamine--glycine ligase
MHWLAQGDVLIEEFLDGEEVSLFVFADGHDVLSLTPAQDFKRLLDGDEGPNTGGMGAYSPLPWLADQFGSIDAFTHECVETVALPVVRQLESEGTPFVGLLYCGLIVTTAGIRVIEFNARFGDPETQVVLPRMVTPLSTVLYASAVGDLAGQAAIEFSDDAVITVVLASENYPDTPVTGREIGGLDDAGSVPGVHITHAATVHDGERLVTSGGRVLSVVARGESFTEARTRAYDAMGRLELQGGHYRRDIAAKVAR